MRTGSLSIRPPFLQTVNYTTHSVPHLCYSLSNISRGRITFIFYFPFLAAPQHMEFPGQGWDSSCGCNLSYSCGNAGSLTHRAGPGIQPECQPSQDATDPTAPWREFQPISCTLNFGSPTAFSHSFLSLSLSVQVGGASDDTTFFKTL